jgi:hypothetical protein
MAGAHIDRTAVQRWEHRILSDAVGRRHDAVARRYPTAIRGGVDPARRRRKRYLLQRLHVQHAQEGSNTQETATPRVRPGSPRPRVRPGSPAPAVAMAVVHCTRTVTRPSYAVGYARRPVRAVTANLPRTRALKMQS